MLYILMPLLVAAVLAVPVYFALKRWGDPRRIRLIITFTLSIGAALTLLHVLDYFDINLEQLKTFSFIFKVLIPTIGSITEWFMLQRLFWHRLERGETRQDLGRIPGWWQHGFMAFGAAMALLSGQIPDVIKSKATIASLVPIIVFAASSAVSAVVNWLTHTRITEHGIFTGAGYVNFSDISKWSFRPHDDRYLFSVQTDGGFFAPGFVVAVSDVQRTALEAVLEGHLPHLGNRDLIAAKS